MNLMRSLKNVAIAAVLLSASVANAALYQFQLTGDYTASWQMESTVESDDGVVDVYFTLWDVEGNFPGSLTDVVDIDFYTADFGGGLGIIDFYGESLLLLADGGQLYTGTQFNPIFLLGTFALTDFFGSGDTYTLTVTDLDAEPPIDVPEPASVALLLGGLGLMAASRKRRQQK